MYSIEGCSVRGNLAELSTCIKHRLNLLKPMLPRGAKSINLPIFDPYTGKSMEVNQSSQLLSLDGKIKNLKIEGFKDFIVKNIFFDPVNLDFHSTVRLPNMTVSTDYNVVGRILFFSLPGSGNFHVRAGW